ncbi:MAG: dephospho-CoA kinase [Ruminococcus sp.]|nr:dephospho-CoA kinase [Ruminococcus sp.]
MSGYIIGLTGQTGSGKSTVSECFAQCGLAVIDCDKVSREVTVPGSECCKALSKYFPSCFDSELTLDRRALGRIVFSDSEQLELLNRTVFPFILEQINSEIEAALNEGCEHIVLDAPTLYESGADKLCSLIVSCVADRKIRTERIMKRDGISAEDAEKRMASQKSESFFRERSDIIIENDGGLEGLAAASRFAVNLIKGIRHGTN